MYTGTHDTPTFVQWLFEQASPRERDFACDYLRLRGDEGFGWGAVCGAWASPVPAGRGPAPGPAGPGRGRPHQRPGHHGAAELVLRGARRGAQPQRIGQAGPHHADLPQIRRPACPRHTSRRRPCQTGRAPPFCFTPVKVTLTSPMPLDAVMASPSPARLYGLDCCSPSRYTSPIPVLRSRAQPSRGWAAVSFQVAHGQADRALPQEGPVQGHVPHVAGHAKGLPGGEGHRRSDRPWTG